MSDFDMIRELRRNDERYRLTEVKEVPTVWLPYAQRALNPQAAAAALGDFAQPWAALLQAFYCSVFVTGTNNGANYWTINLNDTTGTTLATVNTSAMAANTWTRLSDLTVTQPASTNVELVVLTAITAGAPGSIYVVPGVACIRQ